MSGKFLLAIFILIRNKEKNIKKEKTQQTCQNNGTDRKVFPKK